MKKCSSCGATYNDSTNFCSSCGTRLTAVSAQRSRHPGHKKKQHRLIGRLAVPAVVLILVLSTVFIFFYRKEYKPLIVGIKNPDYSDEEAERFEELLADKERERETNELYSPASSTYLRFMEGVADQ